MIKIFGFFALGSMYAMRYGDSGEIVERSLTSIVPFGLDKLVKWTKGFVKSRKLGNNWDLVDNVSHINLASVVDFSTTSLYGKLQVKYLTLNTNEKALFKLHFENADATVLKALDDDVALVDVWENIYKSQNIDVLQAGKRLKAQNLIFNGKFDPINNPGCIGHLDADVEKLLIADGWVKVSDDGSSYSEYTKIIGQHQSGQPKYAYFNYNPGSTGAIHGVNLSYWKYNELTTSNKGVIYRSSNNPNFQFNSNISGSVYINGIKIK